MMINDLEIRKELASEELSAVRGGSNFSSQGGQFAPAVGISGPSFFSSQAVTNAAVNNPITVQNDNDLHLDLHNNVANVAQSLGTLVFQG
jgi:hypothetical protein